MPAISRPGAATGRWSGKVASRRGLRYVSAGGWVDVLDAADLEMNVLEFVHKSFAFARMVEVDGREAAVFQRTETESESQFRPRIVRLYLAVPREWIVLDGAGDSLALAHDGRTRGLTTVGEGQETGAEAAEFTEQGIEFHRHTLPDHHLLYLPAEFETAWAAPPGLRALGFPAP